MKVHWVRPDHLPSQIPCRAWRNAVLRSADPAEVTCLNCLVLIRLAAEGEAPVPGGPPMREGNNPRTGIAWNE